jgi:tetratricopeptide (TPR) repeat protein
MKPGTSREDRLRKLFTRALNKHAAPCRSQEPADYDSALTKGARCLETWQALYDRERAEASSLVAELMGHPPERQVLIVQNNARFQTWGIYTQVLEQSWAQSLQDLADAEHLARLALLLSKHLDPFYRAEAIEDLRARAWAYIANVRRQRSDLAGAEKAFRTARSHLRRGTGDPIEKAMILDLEASLKRAQRRFSRAMSLLKRAHTIFLAAGDRHRAGRSLISMETILHDAGCPEQGIPLLYQALELIDPQQEPRLLLCVWHNLVDDLAEAGRAMEARRLFLKARPLYPRFPEAVTQNRRTWVAGKIARGLGQEKEAEALFLETRQSFLDEDVPYEVALVSLDLAALYARQGRTDELKRLAAEMVPVFSSRQIHREALAALAFWKQAVEAETTRGQMARIGEVVAGVAAFLKRARYDPELRFTTPV